MLKAVLVVLALVSVACGCPVTAAGIDSRADWVAQRDAACAAVQGCDAAWLADVPVYEGAADEVADICAGIGCFCASPGCSGAIVFADLDTKSVHHNTVLHEYTHAAFHSIGVDTADHSPEFKAALLKALQKVGVAK